MFFEKSFDAQSAFMESMDSLTLANNKDDIHRPDLINDADFKSISIIPIIPSYENFSDRSFLLLDQNENLCVATKEMFCKKLKCSENEKIKVVSIFGNTGDGKSHSMNHIFFNGEEVFKTSSLQNSCTVGVSAAMQESMKVLCIDTEGLLGITPNSNQRLRMLLKILAISDIVIYRTRSERLHKDMYDFLSTASNAYCDHFSQALQSYLVNNTAKTLGPAVIIFHETRHTKPLEDSILESPEEKLRHCFSKQNLELNAFSKLRYVGTQTVNNAKTNFSGIIQAVNNEIENKEIRSPRTPDIIFQMLVKLNTKFSGEINENPINPFPEQYFTCSVYCESCNERCQRSMGHETDGENHMSKRPCCYQHQFENIVYLCKACYQNGKRTIVKETIQAQNENSLFSIAKYAWSGTVIECKCHGEIYRSRQHWYGNKSPEVSAVRKEIVHVWKGGNITAKGPANSAQMVLDGVSYISDTITSISAQPTKALTGWLADKVAPSYWKPNSEIIRCHACKKNFEETGLPKHHCRRCGEGFCHACSSNEMPVPERGWNEKVRVCNDCRQELLKKPNSATGPPKSDEADILARKVSEIICNSINSVATVAIEYPKEIIKDSARPAYWASDAESPNCYICKIPFGTAEELEMYKKNSKLSDTSLATIGKMKGIFDCRRHHCRNCGQAICEPCSKTRRPVPKHGWTTPVRICDGCASLDITLNSNDDDDVKAKTD